MRRANPHDLDAPPVVLPPISRPASPTSDTSSRSRPDAPVALVVVQLPPTSGSAPAPGGVKRSYATGDSATDPEATRPPPGRQVWPAPYPGAAPSSPPEPFEHVAPSWRSDAEASPADVSVSPTADERPAPDQAPAVVVPDRNGGDSADGQVPRPPVPGKVVSGSLFTPADLGRKDRRRQERQARQVELAARRARLKADQTQRKAAVSEARATEVLPAGGERRPAALRSFRRLKVQPHRATSDQLGGVYPFLAEAGLGSNGVYVGTDSYSGSAFVFDPFVLYRQGEITDPNILVAGDLGTGKSTLAKSLTTRAVAFGRRVYVPGDPKGEWSVVARAVGGQAIELGRGLRTRLNPLDEGVRPKIWVAADGTHEVMTDELWRAIVGGRRQDLLKAITQSALGRDLGSVEVTAIFAALDTAVRTTDTPTLPAVIAALHDPPADVPGSTKAQLLADGRQTAHALNRLVVGDLAGLFDGPSTARFDPNLSMVSLDLSRIAGSDQLIALVVTCASSWMEAALQDPESPQRFIVYDEAWRTLREPSLLARMQSQWKLARSVGISNMMIIHALSDLDAVGEANSQSRNLALGLLRDCSTKVIYAQEPDQIERTCTGLGLSSAEGAELTRLRRGEALWRVGQDRSFIVSHRITAGASSEQVLFDTNGRMLDKSDRFPASGAENAGPRG